MTKDKLRDQYKKIRASISDERRQRASALATQILSEWVNDWLKNHPQAGKYVLSFAPFKDEIDLWPLNHHLLLRNVLALPKVSGEHLDIYKVSSLDELIPSPLGILEPDINRCKKLMSQELFAVLVPALAIDNNLHRLGFGKGFYDRLLSELSPEIARIGVAFKEQLLKDPLDPEHHDQPLTHRFLF